MNTGRRREFPDPPVIVVDYQFSGQVETAPRWVLSRHSHVWRPPTDLFETEDEFVAQVEIAGMRHADFLVTLNGRQLSISGHRRDPAERRAYYQMEIHSGDFRTDLDLPAPIQAEGVEATYSDGFLRVVLPKLKPRAAE